jgi:hypothetical protein
MSLTLLRYNGSLTHWQEISVFRDWVTACAHLCDHVLTLPEGNAWAEILGQEAAAVILSNAGFRLAKTIWAGGNKGEALQTLYDVYGNELCMALDSAGKTGWHWTDQGDARARKALGISGVLVVFNAAEIRSGMLPGWGNPFYTARAKKTVTSVERRRRNPMPRQSSNKANTPSRGSGGWGIRRRPAGHERKTGREPQTQGLRRYRIFRRCAQSVRAELLASYYREDKMDESGVVDLKETIADFGTWMRLAGKG